MGHRGGEGMRGDRFFPRMIQFVIALGVFSAVFTVGGEVMESEADDAGVASTGTDGGASSPLPAAPTVVPPSNTSDGDENETRDGADSSTLLAMTLA